MIIKQKKSLLRFLPLLILLLALFFAVYFHLYVYLSFSSLQQHRQFLSIWTAQHFALASIIISLFLVDPIHRGLLTLIMMTSILLCITSFLVVGIFSPNNSAKSFHYSPGLMERAEAFIFFGLMILFPLLFTVLAILFSILVFITAVIRVYQFTLTC